MDVAKFERICSKSGFQPLDKIWTPDGAILLAERYFNTHPDASAVGMNGPHWQTLWAIERDGADVGQKIFMPFGAVLPSGRKVERKDRIENAVLAAHQWIKDNLDVGRYIH